MADTAAGPIRYTRPRGTTGFTSARKDPSRATSACGLPSCP